MRAHDTIAAIATAPGRGGVGVVRVSGSGARAVAQGIIGQVPAARRAKVARFCDANGALIDEGIALFFIAPASYTGEDVLELQGHGGPVVLRELLKRCLELGARLAQPGEFTQRAYLNDKLDLAQAESVADLIDASSTQAARAAARSLDGAFSTEVSHLTESLITLRMLVEATLDFPEEDIDFLKRGHAWEKLAAVREALARVNARAERGARLRAGLNVVLAGKPNAGKSSLLNALAGEEAAIVTPIPGTTRDRIERVIDLDGIALNLVDTAGLRETDDIVEAQGVARSRDAIARADLVLYLIDASLLNACLPPESSEVAKRGVDGLRALGSEDSVGGMSIEAELAALPPNTPRLVLLNKSDLAGNALKMPTGWASSADTPAALAISAKTGAGLDALKAALMKAAGQDAAGEDALLARERHLHALREADAHLQAAQSHIDASAPALELFAEELRLAQTALNRITGEFTADDLLGEIFSRFCIGK